MKATIAQPVIARIGILIVLTALVFLISPGVTSAQDSRNCAWPIEISPEGSGNMLAPESLARYWVMPFDKQYESMTIKGTYPNARYFSFIAYDTNAYGGSSGVAGGLYDARIAPDSGSINPFVRAQGLSAHHGSNGTYTVTISRTGTTSGNNIRVATDFAWILLRLYVPDADPSLGGRSLMGGVPLPKIILTENGANHELPTCSPINKLPDMVDFLKLSFPPEFDIIGEEGTPSSDRLWFGAPTDPPPILMPNQDNKYVVMFPGNDYQPERIIVIHAKAPEVPHSFDGSSEGKAPRGSKDAEVRFWSVCNSDLALPVSTVNCLADPTTVVEDGYYTIVVSDDLLRPKWLPSNVNWLPWGDEQYPKVMFFRNMLAAPNFQHSIQKAVAAGCTFDFIFPTLPERDPVDKAGQCAQQKMGDYYPVAVWCDKSTFVHGGWQACINGR